MNQEKSVIESKLPWQDWLLLPLIGISTVLLLAVCTELAARWLYPVSQVGLDNCFVSDDLSGDAPIRPNGLCSERGVESRLNVEYRFNSHGNRAGVELEPKQPGTYRIVMIGSSMAMGLFVPRERSFAAILPTELAQSTGHKVELYNEATGGKFRGGPFPTRDSAMRFNEVIAAEPDLILWVITPMDLQNAALESQAALSEVPNGTDSNGKLPDGARSDWAKFKNAVAAGTVGEKLHHRWEQTRTSLVLQHLLLANESQERYVNSYLENEDDAGFLKIDPSAKWKYSLQILQKNAAEFARRAHAADVPMVAVLVPNRAQAAMISRDRWPDGYDPYKVGDALRNIIEGDGGTYIDILPGLREIPNPEQNYFPIDGHLDANGHAMIAKLLVKKLAGSALRGLAAGSTPHPALAQGR